MTGRAAFWSSWADCMPMIHARHSAVSTLVIQQLSDGNGGFHLGGLAACEQQLRREGFEAPGRRDHGLRPGARQEEERTVGVAPGWQHEATDAVLIHLLETSVRPRLTLAEQALLRSQGGPMSGVPFTSFPTSSISRFESSVFRVLLQRRLWLLLPPSTRKCRCGRLLDVRGHHRAACAVVGVLGRRGFPVESAAARVCREAGARVSTNVMVRDLDILPLDRQDGRKLEVVADGLPLFHGAQLAIDTTIVSPLRADGTPRPESHANDGAALRAARRVKTRTYPELTGEVGGLDWWCWRPKSEGAGQRKLKCSCASCPKRKQEQNQFPSRLKLELRGCTDGALFWHVAAQGRSGCLCWKSEEDSEATVPLPPRRRSLGNFVRLGLLREAAGVVLMRDSLY